MPLPPWSMSRCIRARPRLPPKLWPRVINCPLVIWRHCSRAWSTPKSSRACAGREAAIELARERRRITVGEIVRTAMSLSTADPDDLGSNSVLLERVIDPAARLAGETFLSNLDATTVEEMCETAEKTHVLDDEKVSGDFAI